jgi:hypothetical protein
MSCAPQFPNNISLSCVFGLIADLKNGINVQTVKKALWIAGCLIEKVGPPTLPQGNDEVGLLSVVDRFDVLVGKLEATAYALAEQETDEAVSLALGKAPQASTQGWEVLIPIILEIIKLIAENRRKKEQQPVPPAATAPNLSIMGVELVSDTGSVKAPVTKPATAESTTEPPKKK